MKKEKERIVVKIGTNRLQKINLDELVRYIIKLREKYDVILVSSGAVYFAREKLKKEKSDLIKKLNSKELSSLGQPLLMNAYIEKFNKKNVIVSQVLVSQKVNKNVVERLLSHGILPIINGNDSDNKDDLIFDDNDLLAGEVAISMKAKMLIIITDVEGVYNINPRVNEDAKKFNVLYKITGKILKNSRGVGSENGTGGMYTKLISARKLLKNNISTYITSSIELKEIIIIESFFKHPFKKDNGLSGTIICNK